MSEVDFKIVCSKIDAEKQFLNTISHNIWTKPELKFEEVYAHEILTTALIQHGFDVETNYILPTAFKGEYTSGNGPTIGIMLEYDALPEIGHACGHNLIAEAGLAAGIAVKAAMEADKSINGKIVLLGTPAEEAGGGKIILINRGAFKDIDVAMMVHPSNFTLSDPPFLSRLAITVEYRGKASHASAFPWEGINALDAAVTFYQSLGLLRQQMKPTCRIHAIICKGGTAPNVIPEEASVSICVRAPSRKDLQILQSNVEKCIEGAATSTGCTYNIVLDEESQYDEVVGNPIMCQLYSDFSNKLGLHETDLSTLSTPVPVGSTDMGNVSYTVPSIHPMFKIDEKACNHAKEFTTTAGSLEAQTPTLISAKAMAMTALALMRDPNKVKIAKAQFDNFQSSLKE